MPQPLADNKLNIKDYLKDIQNSFNNKFSKLPQTHPALCQTLQEAMSYVLVTDAKRLRPALLYATFASLTTFKTLDASIQTNSELLLNRAALAIELIHTYSLVHDDLPAMDNDDYRRGKLTCHKKFSEATAILVGDCLQTLAFELLSQSIAENTNSNYSPDNPDNPILSKQLQIINLLSRAAGSQGMVGGQSLELSTTDYNLKLLNKIHLNKTGKLIACCLQIGAILADCNDTNYSLIETLGTQLGLIYQIQDDIFDYNPATKLDLSNRQYCYVSILGLDQTDEILTDLIHKCKSLLTKLNLDENSILSKIVSNIFIRKL